MSLGGLGIGPPLYDGSTAPSAQASGRGRRCAPKVAAAEEGKGSKEGHKAALGQPLKLGYQDPQEHSRFGFILLRTPVCECRSKISRI